MAHFKRKRSRLKAAGHYSKNGYRHRLGFSQEESEGAPFNKIWYRNHPRHWNKAFHIRPTRAKARLLERQILRGEDPDNMNWPNGRKPHIYYW